MSPGKFIGLLLLLALPAHARINVVTLPDRDATQLTIYNSVDLTLVRETRVLTFRRGLNKLEFSWANTRIDPTSVEFRALTQADKVDVLDVSFPPRVTNTLEWRIQSEVAGPVTVEIRYFTSGISWAADYVAEADRQEKQMTLAGYVRVNNQSGEDYERAQIRLVVGKVRLVEEIAQLAGWRGGKDSDRGNVRGVMQQMLKAVETVEVADMAVMSDGGGGGGGGRIPRPVVMVKEGMSEYFLYTVGGRDTIPTGWAKRLPSFRASDVPVTSYYKFERERWGDQVIRHYKFKNDTESKLGNEPLPDGDVKALRRVSADNLLAFIGATQVKYIPLNEEVEMELGNDREVLVKPRLMNWIKEDMRFDKDGNVAGWTTRETWEFELQNSKDIPIALDIRRSFPGDWDVKTAAKYEKMDATKVKFVLPLQPREKQKLAYELTTRHGINVIR